MSGYTIQYLEQLSGIKAHTIRIWEQRYSLLNPKRSDSNIRSYTDDDLKKILGVSTLLHTGYKIGDLAALTLHEINLRVDELEKSNLDDAKIDFASINKLLGAAMAYDEAAFEKVYAQLHKRFSAEHVYFYIIHPFLVRIGTLWNIGKIIPAQEHFVSNLIRQKLFTAIDKLPLPDSAECWVLYLPENEEHEIGLLFTHYMLRLFGKKTIYLGQRVPFENLKHVVTQANAAGILCFQIVQPTAKESQNFMANLATLSPTLKKIICCAPTAFQNHDLNGIYTLTNPEAFITWLKTNA